MQGCTVDKGADAGRVDAVNTFASGFENEASAIFLFAHAAFGLAAFIDDGAKDEAGKREDQHEKLDEGETFKLLGGEAHHESQAGIEEEKADDGAAQAAPCGDPDDGKKEKIEEMSAASEGISKGYEEGEAESSEEAEIFEDPLWRGTGECRGLIGGGLPGRVAEKFADSWQNEFEEKWRDTEERDNIANPPCKGSDQVVLGSDVVAPDKNGGA